MSVFYLSVCLCGALNRTQPTHLSVLYLYIHVYTYIYMCVCVCNQATSFDGVVPLYFYLFELFELLFCFLLWKIKYLSIYMYLSIM